MNTSGHKEKYANGTTKIIVIQAKNLVDNKRIYQKSYSFAQHCLSVTNSIGLQDFLNINNNYWLCNFSVWKKYI
jgi:hypothetical protein